MLRYYLVLLVLLCSLVVKSENPSAIVKTTAGNFEIELFIDKTPLNVKSFYRLATGQKEWIDVRDKTIYRTDFYDSLTVHRVVKNFVVQMGCYLGNSMSDPGFAVPDEIYDGEIISGKIEDEIIARRVMEEIIIPYIKNQKDRLFGNPEIVELFKECSLKKSARPLMKYPIEYYLKLTKHEAPFIKKTKIKSLMEYGSVALANTGAPSSGSSQFFIVTRRNGAPKMDGKFTIFGKIKSGMGVIHKIESVEVDEHYAPVKPIYILGIDFKDPEHKLN